MPGQAKTHQELLQAAALLLDWNLAVPDTPFPTLIARAQQHRLTHAAETAYHSCFKSQYGGSNAMVRMWEDVLRFARAGAVDMSDVGQGGLTRKLASTRPDLIDILATVDVGTSCTGADRTARLRSAADELARRCGTTWSARTRATLTLPAPPSVSAESAVLGWYSIFEMCMLPEPNDPGGTLPFERAAVAVEALGRGLACDRAYWNTAARGRVSSPTRYVGNGASSWVTARALVAVAEQYGDPVAVARAWAREHDEWVRPRDEPVIATRIVRTLFECGRTADALRALEMACRRADGPTLAPELVDVSLGLCAALLASGDREGAERALPPALRTQTGPADRRRGGPRFDPEIADALRQALVDPQLGLTALRRVWYATYRDEPADSASGWLVSGALVRCLRESGAEAEAGIVAALSRRMLDEPGNEQQHRMRSLLAVGGRIESEEQAERDRERLHGLLDELQGLLLRAPHLASDPRLARELGGIARVARRARVLFRPVRNFVLDRPLAPNREP